jgi:ParB family chromosome partitioning protein
MSLSQFSGDSIFWIEVDKIKPNPFQPRREFDEARLKDLSESIRMYGILQPLTVTRREFEKPEGGLAVEYELIAGERRLRASKLAGLQQVPALIRTGEQDDRVKLELAIIENLQREDINSVDRARAFDRLAKEFGLKHVQIAEKVGKSREYVSNTMRILALPEEILNALSEGKLSEGHTRPLLMLIDKKEEQMTLFKEIVIKKITVREAEAFARNIARDKVRKKSLIDPALAELEQKFKDTLGTKVYIEKKENGGRIMIDFFDDADIQEILKRIMNGENKTVNIDEAATISNATNLQVNVEENITPIDDRAPEEIVKEMEEDNDALYSMKNFNV